MWTSVWCHDEVVWVGGRQFSKTFELAVVLIYSIILLILGWMIQIPMGYNHIKKNSPAKSLNVTALCNSTVLMVFATK
jgi:hypothetical protein